LNIQIRTQKQKGGLPGAQKATAKSATKTRRVSFIMTGQLRKWQKPRVTQLNSETFSGASLTKLGTFSSGNRLKAIFPVVQFSFFSTQ
jgi:hypothetical protein